MKCPKCSSEMELKSDERLTETQFWECPNCGYMDVLVGDERDEIVGNI